MIVDLPEPVLPTRNTKSSRSIEKRRLIEADVAGRVALRDAPEFDHRFPARGAADDLSRMRGGGDDGAPRCPLRRLFRGSHLWRAAYRACRFDVRSCDRLQCCLQD